MIICIGPILQYLVFMSIFLALNSVAHICYDATIVDDETAPSTPYPGIKFHAIP